MAKLQHCGNKLINMQVDSGEDHVMVDRLPLSRRRSPGRRRGLLSLPFFCRIEGKVYAKFPKFQKNLWVFQPFLHSRSV